jgi:protoporphyrinogen oxidase
MGCAQFCREASLAQSHPSLARLDFSELTTDGIAGTGERDVNMPAHTERWGVIGGGMLGMTIAHRLVQAGKRVVLYEASAYLGGLSGTWQLGKVNWDKHFHFTLSSDSALRSLLEEIGLGDEMEWQHPTSGIFASGQLHPISYGRYSNSAGDTTDWRRSIEQVLQSDDQGTHYRIPALVWLTERSGRGMVDRLWRPLLRAWFGESCERISAAFVRTFVGRMYPIADDDGKKVQVGYTPGGYGRILERFSGLLCREGVLIRRAYRAQRVETWQNHVLIEFENGKQKAVDRAVLALPGRLAGPLCPELSTAEREQYDNLAYRGVVCASVLLKKPLSGFLMTSVLDPALPFTAVVEMSALVDCTTFAGQSLVYLPKYVALNDSSFEKSDREIGAEYLGGLMRMYPHIRPGDIVGYRISRVREVFPIPIGSCNTLPFMATSIPGVYIANSTQSVGGSFSVNDAVDLANRAVRALVTPALSSATIPVVASA